ncbi:GNAT family N-acetyltransferase [Pseudoalteromonas luteoviolacea]|uniref:GNAT family N-acetyltransferase n=1 Tax=Pseudoalteromonas luteoviolacea TaxID=43657 RepID=UPI0011519F1D|nr:GNAT family N-acetyltransferase [Pseudoalteromonas luteoviolacea]TQF70290.1 GNAT family N-acetyltransferase [Pseudoalteromonas luteoviolacea]
MLVWFTLYIKQVRTLTSSDWVATFEIYAQSKLDELRNEQQQLKLIPLENDHIRLTELKESNIYIIEDKEIMGFGAICHNEIRALFVHPNFRGNGIV